MSRSRKRRPKSRVREIAQRFLYTLLQVLFILMFVTISQVILFKFIDPPVTYSMIRGWMNQKLFDGYYQQPAYTWCSLNDISPHLRRAVLAGEDQRFLRHHGFDFIEFKEALKGIFSGKRIRGASTISMQAARSLFLWSDRSMIRKLAEAYYTILLEALWSKERILEIYLNTVDWGGGVIGAEAATQKYFRTHAHRITVDQAASMVAILPSPYRRSPVNLNERTQVRRDKILREMQHMPLVERR